MQTGIIGLPQVGKTTLFRILTKAHLDEKAARGATHVGVARVPEPRLAQLAELYHPKKITYATVEYVDVGGMARDRARDSAVLAPLREVEIGRAHQNGRHARTKRNRPLQRRGCFPCPAGSRQQFSVCTPHQWIRRIQVQERGYAAQIDSVGIHVGEDLVITAEPFPAYTRIRRWMHIVQGYRQPGNEQREDRDQRAHISFAVILG